MRTVTHGYVISLSCFCCFLDNPFSGSFKRIRCSFFVCCQEAFAHIYFSSFCHFFLQKIKIHNLRQNKSISGLNWIPHYLSLSLIIKGKLILSFICRGTEFCSVNHTSYLKPLNETFLSKYDLLVKYLVADWMSYWEQMYTRLLTHVDIDYWKYYNELIPLQEFLVVVHSHHFCLWLSFFYIFRCQKVQIARNFNFEYNPILSFFDIYLGWWFISKCFSLLDDMLKIFLINQVTQMLHLMFFQIF